MSDVLGIKTVKRVNDSEHTLHFELKFMDHTIVFHVAPHEEVDVPEIFTVPRPASTRNQTLPSTLEMVAPHLKPLKTDVTPATAAPAPAPAQPRGGKSADKADKAPDGIPATKG